MDECPVCDTPISEALVICGNCGEVLPLRVVVVSEGSHGGGFAVVEESVGRGDEPRTEGDKVQEVDG